jgi:hypothetical protein
MMGKKRKEKMCEICGKKPASGLFMVLCKDCKEKMRDYFEREGEKR